MRAFHSLYFAAGAGDLGIMASTASCGGFGADTARASAIQAALNSPRPALVEATGDPDEQPTNPVELKIGTIVPAAELPQGISVSRTQEETKPWLDIRSPRPAT
jgi:hypothetical protein